MCPCYCVTPDIAFVARYRVYGRAWKILRAFPIDRQRVAANKTRVKTITNFIAGRERERKHKKKKGRVSVRTNQIKKAAIREKAEQWAKAIEQLD